MWQIPSWYRRADLERRRCWRSREPDRFRNNAEGSENQNCSYLIKEEYLVKSNKNLIGSIIAGGLLLITASAFATDVDNLANMLAEKGVISYGEAQQVITESKEDIRKQIAQGKAATLPAWIQNISMKGDLRLRYQMDWPGARNRSRLRLRTGFETRVVDGLKAGFGLATGAMKDTAATTGAGTNANNHTHSVSSVDVGDTEPRSTNYTFQNEFSKPTVMIDYAYLEYAPFGWMKVTGGKMKNPVWSPTDNLWDTDINPDGLTATFSYSITPALNVSLTPSYFIIDEINSTTLNDADAYVAQPAVTWAVNDTIDLKAAVAYQSFNVKGKAITSAGNSTTYTTDFVCLNPALQVNLKNLLFGYSLSLFGDSVANSADGVTADKNGYSAGAQFGDAKVAAPGQWSAKYIQRNLEANAFPNRFPDSDAYGGATNTKGYEAIVEIGLTRSANLSFDYYSMDVINGVSSPKSLMQVDVVYKF